MESVWGPSARETASGRAIGGANEPRWRRGRGSTYPPAVLPDAAPPAEPAAPRVVHLPVYAENAFQPVLMAAQRELGWTVIDGGGGGNFLRTALREWRADVLHLHWLHPYLLRAGAWGSWKRAGRFLAEIALLKRRGAKVVWTVHNLTNHEGRHPRLELTFTRAVVRLCDAVVTHGAAAAEEARPRFLIPRRTPVVSVPLPAYTGHFPPAPDRLAARRSLGLYPAEASDEEVSAGRVFAFAGRVEPYKCPAELVAAFSALSDPTARLLIAGSCQDGELAADLRRRAAADPRVRLDLRYVPDEELPTVLAAADVVACPSRGVLTSSSVLLGMSFDRPVLAPAAGCVPEAVGGDAADGGAAFLYDPADPNGLAAAVARAAAASETDLAAMRAAAADRAAASAPARVAATLCDLYSDLCGKRPAAVPNETDPTDPTGAAA